MMGFKIETTVGTSSFERATDLLYQQHGVKIVYQDAPGGVTEFIAFVPYENLALIEPLTDNPESSDGIEVEDRPLVGMPDDS